MIISPTLPWTILGVKPGVRTCFGAVISTLFRLRLFDCLHRACQVLLDSDCGNEQFLLAQILPSAMLRRFVKSVASLTEPGPK